MFVYIAIFLPFKISFIDDSANLYVTIDHVVDILFGIDIIISMLTAYYEGNELVHDLKTLMINYLKGWFWFDLISTFPFELVINFNRSLVFLTRLSKLLKILKLFRLARMTEQFNKNKLSKKFFSFFNVDQQFSEFITFSCIVILLTHVTGCFWYFVSNLESGNSWLNAY